MKNIAMIIALLCVLSSVTLADDQTWKVTSLEWQPYSGPELVNQGSAIEKLRRLLSAQGISLVVEFYPWKRAQELAKTKDYVGYFPAWPEEVHAGFTASGPVAWSEIGVMKLSGASVSYQGVDDLFKKYKVGVVSTYTYPEIIASAMQKYPHHVEGSMSEILLVRKLCGGRHPVAITDPRVMQYLAQRENIASVEVVEIITKKELVVAFRNEGDNTHRLERFNRLLAERH